MDIVLFGAGKTAEKIYQQRKEQIKAVIDNDINKIGGQFHGLPIISLEDYKKSYNGITIVIATFVYQKVLEITRQLYAEGIKNYFIMSEFYEDASINVDPDIMHGKWSEYLKQLCDKPGYEILELGSRIVSGDCFRELFEYANYTGFDYYEGANVDIVGDIHKLSSYFDKKFDLIFCSAVFEHLAMPWQASLEIIKLLKPGGYVFIETHYSYSSHERPWHFFQFSENALNILFPERFGIECVKKGCCNLLEGRFSDQATEYLRGQLVPGLYCHSEFLGRKKKELPEEMLSWNGVQLEDVSMGTEYPYY